MQRRLHLRVGADRFLPVLLRVADGPAGWFDETALNKLLSMLRDELPSLLPSVLEQRTPAQMGPQLRHIDNIAASLIWQPTSSSIWLVGNSGQTAGDESPSLAAVPYSLILDVRHQEDSDREQGVPLPASSPNSSLEAFVVKKKARAEPET
jgi:hypothetical protein